MRRGDLVDQILEEEAHRRPGLIVLAIQRHMNFLDTLRSSTTEHVLRGARALFSPTPPDVTDHANNFADANQARHSQ